MSVSKLPQTVQSVQNVEDREDTDREDINKITNQQGLSESAVAELNGKCNNYGFLQFTLSPLTRGRWSKLDFFF